MSPSLSTDIPSFSFELTLLLSSLPSPPLSSLLLSDALIFFENSESRQHKINNLLLLRRPLPTSAFVNLSQLRARCACRARGGRGGKREGRGMVVEVVPSLSRFRLVSQRIEADRHAWDTQIYRTRSFERNLYELVSFTTFNVSSTVSPSRV